MSSNLKLAYQNSIIESSEKVSKNIPLSSDNLVNKLWKKIVSLTSLPDNWDSYGAVPLKECSIYAAISYVEKLLKDKKIPEPDVIPVSNGNIQLEWSCYDIDLEIEISSENSLHVFYQNLITNESWEEDIEYDFTGLIDSINALEKLNIENTRFQLVS